MRPVPLQFFVATLLATPPSLLAATFGEQISAEGIRHSFLLTGNKTALIGEDCETMWSVNERSRDGEVLADGNLLIAFAKSVKEFTRTLEVVFEYKLSPENSEIGTVSRLENGNTLITELGKKPRLLEIGRDGKVVATCPLQPETGNAHMQTRMARKTPAGTYLVPHLLAFAVKEYRPDGSIVRTIATDLPELGGREGKNWPFTAILLNDQSVMVNLTNGNKTVIFGADGKPQWVTTNEDVDNRFADPCGGNILGNGNLVICSYGQGKDGMPDVFEITREKKVVWEFKADGFKGAHEIHVLTTNGRPANAKR
ncbi:hypothetical protein [Haloferula helveola]|uniref:beta-propeller domain-containing protein n=1 Tax=Haloferula helveola TaxID=490095 RepID=UPI0030D1EBBA